MNLNGTEIRAAITNTDGHIIETREAALDSKNITLQIARMIAELREIAPIAAVGIGVPGLVNKESGRIIVSNVLPSLVQVDLRATVAQASGFDMSRIILENDANAAAYGEWAVGAGRSCRNLFYVTIGTGIGGALLVSGNIWRGASGFAGEFGHITIDPEGVQCVCGNIGCLETVASAPNIVRRTRERLRRDNTSSLSRLGINKNFTAADVAHEAMNGDDFATIMLERTGRYIAIAAAAVINLLNVERIIFGGDVMEAGDLILDPIIHEADRRSFKPCFDATQIVISALGANAVGIGAALLAREASLSS
ncbi:MAG: ROK family protein [Pyrinomonadaceae bacterium]